jgi:hypothetical protein
MAGMMLWAKGISATPCGSRAEQARTVAVSKVVGLAQLFKHPAAQPAKHADVPLLDHGALDGDVCLEVIWRGIVIVKVGLTGQPVMSLDLQRITSMPVTGHSSVSLQTARLDERHLQVMGDTEFTGRHPAI